MCLLARKCCHSCSSCVNFDATICVISLKCVLTTVHTDCDKNSKQSVVKSFGKLSKSQSTITKLNIVQANSIKTPMCCFACRGVSQQSKKLKSNAYKNLSQTLLRQNTIKSITIAILALSTKARRTQQINLKRIAKHL